MGRLIAVVGVLLVVGGIASLVLGTLGIPADFARTHHVMMLCIGVFGITIGGLLIWARYFALD